MIYLTLASRSVLLGFLGAFALRDCRYKKIPLIPVGVLFVLGIIYQIIAGESSFPQVMLSLLPGLLLLLTAKLSRQAVGYGDGLVFIAAGTFLGLFATLFLALFSLILSALAGAFLMIFKKYHGKDTMPFLPFVLGGYICLLLFID